jgi:tricorn protease
MKKAAVFFLTCLVFLSVPALADEGRLMRFPDIYGETIVFSYAGDLWLVSQQGGIARKITSDPGLELCPKFSPDGRWIAFTGQYDGNFNVFVIPSEGGIPRQLTFEPDVEAVPERMGPNNEVIEWYPDGGKILYLTRRRTYNTWFGSLYGIPVEGGLPEAVPLPKGGLTSFSPDGNKIAYNRIFRNFRTWKHYRGGMAQDIWIYDFKKNTIERVTDYPGTDTYPMWAGNKIYFGSDRGEEHRMNLYVYDLETKETRQLTHFKEFDVNWPSLGPSAIVFENGGYLYLLDLKSEQVRKVTVELPGDRPGAKNGWVETKKLITDFELSPDGKRAAFVARGDVYTIPEREGSTRNLTETPGVHEKFATWSPDGKWIAYLSDKTGEDEVYIVPGNGEGKETRITFDGSCYRYNPVWSPDSRKLLFADKKFRLYYVDIEKKEPVLIDSAVYWEIREYVWSPDSRWVAYAKPQENTFSTIYLYCLEDEKITPLGTGFTNDHSPVFGREGNILYFLSERDYNPLISTFDSTYAYDKLTRIYAITLQADEPSPMAPRSDEARVGEEPGEKETEKEKEKETAGKRPERIRIDLEGISKRVTALPTEPANMSGLAAAKKMIFYISSPTTGLSGPFPGESTKLHMFDFAERKDYVLLSPVDGFVLGAWGDKILYKSKDTYGIFEVAPVEKPGGEPEKHKVGDGALDLSGLKTRLNRLDEWTEIFHEAWRLQRDFFYSPVMGGVDWDAVGKTYAQLLPYVADRYDLTYVLGQMIGELSNSHTYTGGGDLPDLKPVEVGYLGVDFGLDPDSGRYFFKKIYKGQNWTENARSPLTEPGIDIKEGDFLLAMNDHPLKSPASPYSLFENTADQLVRLKVNSSATEEGAREIKVKPIKTEYDLRYLNWVEENRVKVEEASRGLIGYVYIPDMSATGLNEFVRQYYPQIRKKGLILDVRYNGGGFVDQMILERLRRILAAMGCSRNGPDTTIPDQVFYGHMACLTNDYAASDGDFFTYFFKKYNLGPVIGMRTWGGVRGIRGYTPLIDGGYVTMPEFSIYDLASGWIIENWGVEPDIEVDNRPDLVVEGHDPQLEAAVDYLVRKIKSEPRVLPSRPPYLPPYPKQGRWE